MARSPTRAKKPKRTYRSAARATREAAKVMAVFGERVRAARNARELSQEEAAERAGIGARHWQLVESGKANVTLATCAAIAAALDVPLATLLDGV